MWYYLLLTIAGFSSLYMIYIHIPYSLRESRQGTRRKVQLSIKYIEKVVFFSLALLLYFYLWLINCVAWKKANKYNTLKFHEAAHLLTKIKYCTKYKYLTLSLPNYGLENNMQRNSLNYYSGTTIFLFKINDYNTFEWRVLIAGKKVL